MPDSRPPLESDLMKSKQLIMLAALAVVIVAGAVFYFVGRSDKSAIPVAGGAPVAVASSDALSGRPGRSARWPSAIQRRRTW